MCMCGHMFVHIHSINVHINTCVYVLLRVTRVHVLSTCMHCDSSIVMGQENVSQAERGKGAILDVLDMTT